MNEIDTSERHVSIIANAQEQDGRTHVAAILRALLSERDGLAKDAARWRLVRLGLLCDEEGPYITQHVPNSWGIWHNTVEREEDADAAADKFLPAPPQSPGVEE